MPAAGGRNRSPAYDSIVGEVGTQNGRCTRVFLVEDHPVFAEGLRALLAAEADLEIAGVAHTVAGALEHLRLSLPDVLVSDYRLPDGTGAALLNALARPELPTIILTGDESDAALLDAIEAGACGYLIKTHAPSRIVDAVRRAARGEMLVDSATLRTVLQRRAQSHRTASEREALLDSLTPREREVLLLMSSGLDNREIAETLVIEYSTVRHHVGNVVSKLGAHSKLEAVARATRLNLVPN